MDKMFYQGRREKVFNLLPNNSMMILFAGKDVRESEDQSYEFCINRNFYYLTGINEQNDILVMIKKDEELKTIIFINRYDELFAKWNGRKMFDHEVKELLPVQAPSDQFMEKLLDYGMPIENIKMIKELFKNAKAEKVEEKEEEAEEKPKRKTAKK